MIGNLNNQYKIIRELSANRNGVFLVEGPNDFFVLKQRSDKRLLAEYNALLACKGPYICEAIQLNNDGLFLKYYPNSRSLIAMDDKESDIVLDALIKAYSALKWCHSRGYVHGDFKPSNLLILPDKSIKLIDFGAALKIGTSYSSLEFYEYSPFDNNKTSFKVATPRYDLLAYKYYAEIFIKKSPNNLGLLMKEFLDNVGLSHL